MSKLIVSCFSLSVDGFGAGPDQSLDNPIGVGGLEMMDWMRTTRTFLRMYGEEGGDTGPNDTLARGGFENVGAWILGRNMFGPIRGPWPDEEWKGWWGPNPPYHVPTFVLTHHPRPPLEMEGGTTFHFVTSGVESALQQARAAAGGKNIRLGGGVSTIRRYLSARLVDELHLALVPTLLGQGEALLAGLDLTALGYSIARSLATPQAMHVFLERSG